MCLFFFEFIGTSNFLPICNRRCLVSFVALIKWWCLLRKKSSLERCYLDTSLNFFSLSLGCFCFSQIFEVNPWGAQEVSFWKDNQLDNYRCCNTSGIFLSFIISGVYAMIVYKLFIFFQRSEFHILNVMHFAWV